MNRDSSKTPLRQLAQNLKAFNSVGSPGTIIHKSRAVGMSEMHQTRPISPELREAIRKVTEASGTFSISSAPGEEFARALVHADTLFSINQLWKPASTAPKDGRWVMGLSTHGKIEQVQWVADWASGSGGNPRGRWARGNMSLNMTHWVHMSELLKVLGVPEDHPARFREMDNG